MVRKLAPKFARAGAPHEDIRRHVDEARGREAWNFLAVGAWAGKDPLPAGDQPGLRAERDETLPSCSVRSTSSTA